MRACTRISVYVVQCVYAPVPKCDGAFAICEFCLNLFVCKDHQQRTITLAVQHSRTCQPTTLFDCDAQSMRLGDFNCPTITELTRLTHTRNARLLLQSPGAPAGWQRITRSQIQAHPITNRSSWPAGFDLATRFRRSTHTREPMTFGQSDVWCARACVRPNRTGRSVCKSRPSSNIVIWS